MQFDAAAAAPVCLINFPSTQGETFLPFFRPLLFFSPLFLLLFPGKQVKPPTTLERTALA